MCRCWAFGGIQYAAEVCVHVQCEIQSFLLLTFGAAGSSSAEHVQPSGLVLQCNVCNIHVSLHASLHGVSQQQVDTEESEVKIVSYSKLCFSVLV